MKRTTAGYMRPSGKNIDRNIEEADETTGDDEWGVRPNDGWTVDLNTEQETRLYLSLRNREVFRDADAEAADDDDSSSDEDESEDEEEPFVDAQLQKAIEFLRAELNSTQPSEASDAVAKTVEGDQPESPSENASAK